MAVILAGMIALALLGRGTMLSIARAPDALQALKDLRPEQIASSDFRLSMCTLVHLARLLQSPGDAMNQFGDPVYRAGAVSPEMQFNLSRVFDLSSHLTNPTAPGELWITLWYGPPAKAPHRLKAFEVGWGPAPDEKEVIEWLGPPKSIEQDAYHGRELNYHGEDRINLGVIVAYWQNSRVEMQFAGAPRTSVCK